MDMYLFRMLELTVNTNEYLKTGNSKICRFMIDLNISTIDRKDIIKVTNGEMTSWYKHLKDNGIEKVKFSCDPNLKFYLTHCEAWRIIGYPEIRQDISYVCKFRFQDRNIGGVKSLGVEYAEHEEKTSECFVFAKDEFFEFKKTLKFITKIAHELKWHHYEDKFQSSLDILSGKIDIETALINHQHYEFRLSESYGLEAQRRLCAIGNLMVFSGMGNWADSPIATAYPETQLLFTYGLSALAHTINYGT